MATQNSNVVDMKGLDGLRAQLAEPLTEARDAVEAVVNGALAPVRDTYYEVVQDSQVTKSLILGYLLGAGIVIIALKIV